MPRGIYKRKSKSKSKSKVAKSPRKPKWRHSVAAEPFAVTDEVVQDDVAKYEAHKEQLAGEGIPHQKWYPGAVLVKPSGYTELHTDTVNHPAHYLQHPSGIECIAITEHFNFNRGNAIKYIWRADEKGSTLENLRKARWYLDREILRLEQEAIK